MIWIELNAYIFLMCVVDEMPSMDRQCGHSFGVVIVKYRRWAKCELKWHISCNFCNFYDMNRTEWPPTVAWQFGPGFLHFTVSFLFDDDSFYGGNTGDLCQKKWVKVEKPHFYEEKMADGPWHVNSKIMYDFNVSELSIMIVWQGNRQNISQSLASILFI